MVIETYTRKLLISGNNGLWLAGGDGITEDQVDSEWLELQCTCALTSLAGSLVPDATVCTALTDALHYCGADVGVERQLTVCTKMFELSETNYSVKEELRNIDMCCSSVPSVLGLTSSKPLSSLDSGLLILYRS